MADLSYIEKRQLEQLLGMSSGYVLDFSNRTFQDFVWENVGLDIFDEKYSQGSGSKANRLRGFWRVEPNHVVGVLLRELVKYFRLTTREPDQDALAAECLDISERLLQDNPMSQDQSPLVFVSYARPDNQGAKAAVGLLSDAGVRTWFDKKDLKGGQDWEYVIRQRIGEAALVLVCLSTSAADRKGFFHQEMRYAVSEAMKLPKGKVYIMPVRLDECAIPDELRQWHALDLFIESGSRDLLRSVGDAIGYDVRARNEAHSAFAKVINELNSGRTGRHA